MKRKTQGVTPEAPAIQVYQLDDKSGLTVVDRISIDEKTGSHILERIQQSGPELSKPVLTINYVSLTDQDRKALSSYAGKRLIACRATKYILQERIKVETPALNNMINILSGRFFMEGVNNDALYFQWAPMLDTKVTHQMSPAIFSSKLCEGIAKMAEALEPAFPDSMPDFGSVRVRNTFQENQIQRIGDLKRLQPYEILRMKNFGYKSIMTVFIGMLELIKPKTEGATPSQSVGPMQSAWM